MANKKGHRRFGSVRQRKSGRWQARYIGPDGLVHVAPHTFPGKRDAEQWLSVVEAEIIRGDWMNPELGRVPFSEFGANWIRQRKVSQRTREEHASVWRNHIEPFLGRFRVNEVTPEIIRAWRADLLDKGRSEDRTAKAYRLARSMFATAVDDGRIKRNPCRIKGADQHRTPERPHASVDEVYRLADVVPGRYRFLVLLAAFSGLRWGELIALRRRDIDRKTMIVRVARRVAQLKDGEMSIGPTKSAAGVRTVALPKFLAEDLTHHLAEFAEGGRDGLLFVGKRGGVLRRGNFHRETGWTKTVVKAGLPKGFHFHDLRHTGNQMAAEAGATTRELMQRMGQSSVRAALIYQHATSVRDQQIADELNARVERHRQGASEEDDGPEEGTAGVLAPVG
ncbi:tyrosine-type recombinase/integrase [Amycolatopsis pithecellobii]|uniref:Tyrosine-type recombinase/integrase n=1 Tax=Amycolatopsis pithecellobii TaxID=664692 RepID=A0A6N7YUX4_9PSEU|nr:site-specific integrase [Amycolatopsis pithecellobii]MTD56877.1 tyrosine-type recombinase/integrase [Amycolatopsis pithecellobii]